MDKMDISLLPSERRNSERRQANTLLASPTGDGAVVLDSILYHLKVLESTSVIGPVGYIALREDLIARAETGLKKYGTRLRVNNGRAAEVDCYQELLDASSDGREDFYFQRELRDARIAGGATRCRTQREVSLRTGTKTVLFGYHQFLLHPFILAVAWKKLYGFPCDPRLWASFFLHDIGYLCKPNIDGVEGQLHPFDGALIMHFLFDSADDAAWYHFVLYHSRTIAKTYFAPLSRLGYADKLAVLLSPKWLLRVLYFFSGELTEYMKNCEVSTWDEWYAGAVAHNRKTLSELDSSHTSVL